MLIKTKYIDCASKSVFNTWKLPTSAADTSGDIYWSAIVYIQDTGEVWTHGKLYGGFFSNADSNKVSLTIGGTTKILALDGHVQSYTTLTGSGTTADQAILSTGVANKWALKTLGKNAFSNVDYLPADATAVAAEKVVNAMRFQYNGKDMHSFDGSAARLLNIIQGDNVFITGDSQGNVTIAADPGSDIVNTAGATNLIDKKLFLIGAESQTTSPQTYSNQYVYIGTDNCLYSLGKKVLTEHQAIYNLDLQTQVGDAVTKVTTFDPNAANNSFTLVQGTNVTLIPDATNKKVTISSKDTTYDFYNLIFKQGDTVVDTYKPTTSPNKSFKAGTNVTFTKSGDEITVTTRDTRNTAGATEKLATKLFLTGSLTQTDNPQTYTNSKVYIGADNKLYSDGKVVSTGDHTHNYAGATTPGGPALKVGLNPSGLLGATYGSYGGILQDSNNGPAIGSWSNRIKILHNNSSGYYTELAQAMTGTAGLWHRRNVAGVVSGWTPVIDKANFRTYLDTTYVIRGDDPNVLTNYVRYSIASGLTMNWEAGNATPTHIWGAKNSDSSKAYVFNGDNIRAFANAVNRAGDTMTGTLKVTEIQATNGNGLVMWNGTTYTYLGMQAGTTYIRSGKTDLQHRYNGTDYKIWDARNLVGLRTEHSHNTINHIDSRDVASTPQEHGAGVWLDFKANAKANLTDGGTYVGLLTVRKYGSTTDWAGGKSAQLGFTDNSNLWVRFGTGTAWEAWQQLATTTWSNGKFLPLAGGTMTGSITISTDSVLQWSRNTDYAKIHFKNTGDADADSYLGFETGDNGNEYFKFSGKNGSTVTQWMSIKSGGVTAPAFIKRGSSDSYVLLGAGGHKALDLFIQVDRGSSINNRDNKGTNQAWFDYNFGGSGIVGSAISFTGLSNYATQLCAGYSDANAIGIRTYNGDKQTWNPVKRLWHNGNLTPGNYVLKAGDTMTGKLNWSMNGVASSIGSENGSYTHYNTNASAGHWFNKNVYSAGNFYGGSSYNRILPFKDEINSQVGGSKSAQMLWSSWSIDSKYGGAIQIREYGNVTNNQSAWSYSPAISFHWGNRYAKRFGMRSDGQFAVDDVPISLSTHNHNSLYVTALGTNGNYLTWTKNGTANNITVPYATNADKLDGYHATSFTRRYGINVTTNTTVNVDAYTKSESGTRTAGSVFTEDGWAWDSSAYIKLNGSYTIDRMKYSIFSYRNGNLTGSWQQQALLFLPTYRDSSAIYLAQMTTSDTAGTVSTSIKRYIDYDTTVANITGGNVSSSTNADKLDGYHANGLFTGLSNSGNNISISIGGTTKTLTVGYASSAGSATTATYLPYQDTRSTNYTPYQSGFNTKGWSATHLKQNTTDGLSDGGIYHSSIYVYPWGDSTCGHAHNLAFTDNGNMWMRHGTSSWSSWVKVYTSGNINPVDKTLLKKTRVPGEVIDFYVYRVGNSYATSTDYTTFKNLLFDSSGRGKSSVTYYATYSNSYTVDLSDFVLCSGNMSGYSNGAYMAGAGELETNRVGQSVGANSKTISGLEMPKHAHWFGYYRSDNANDRDVFGPDGGQNHSTNGTTSAGQGGNWRTGYSGSGQSKDWRPRTVFVFKMIYAPKTW
jgi:hypothetical protein